MKLLKFVKCLKVLTLPILNDDNNTIVNYNNSKMQKNILFYL